MNKKIGLVTFFESSNYGAVLQAFATQKYIEDNTDFACEIIRIRRDTHAKNSAALQSSEQKPSFLNKVIGKLNSKQAKKLGEIKLKRFKEFRKNKIKCSEKLYENADDVKADALNYSAFVCGSDQIWNPFHKIFSDGYMLSFVPDGIYKFSYASSFGVDDISQAAEKEKKAEYLKRLNAVSVREESGADIIEKMGLDRPCVTMDPAFLLNKNEWNEALGLTENAKKEKYVLVYALINVSKAVKKQIEGFAKEKGLKIKIIPDNRQNTQNFYDKPFDAGPKEFVSLIQNAEYVFTNSFHGAVFSLIFKKQVFGFIGDDENARKRACRIIELFEKAGLESRVISGNENLSEYNNIDYSVTDEALQKEIDASKKYFKENLEKVK